MRSILFASLLAFTATVFAADGGSKAGDGGHGLLCNSKSQSLTIYLLDLFEARFLYRNFDNTKWANTDSWITWPNWETQLYFKKTRVLRKAREVLGENHKFLSRIQMLTKLDTYSDDLLSVTPTKDYGIVLATVPSHCSLVQLGRRVLTATGEKLELNFWYWSLMPPQDRFALLLHESLHGWFSGFDSSTMAVRQAVMYLMASDDFRERNAELFRQVVETRLPVDPTLWLP